jgi:hypothetical protein
MQIDGTRFHGWLLLAPLSALNHIVEPTLPRWISQPLHLIPISASPCMGAGTGSR